MAKISCFFLTWQLRDLWLELTRWKRQHKSDIHKYAFTYPDMDWREGWNSSLDVLKWRTAKTFLSLSNCSFHFSDTENVVNRYFKKKNKYLGVYWPLDNSYTVLQGEQLASSGKYRQVSTSEILGKFDGFWWTGHIIYSFGT